MQNILRYLAICFSIALLIIFFGLYPIRANQPSADQLTLIGHKLLDNGQPHSALNMWEKALELYRINNNKEGISGSLINESIALQKMGYISRACVKAAESLKINSLICNREKLNDTSKVYTTGLLSLNKDNFSSSLKITGLQSLGDTLRKVGNLEQSILALDNALKIAENTSEDINPIRLSIANTSYSIFLKAKNKSISSENDIKRKLLIRDTIKTAQSTYNLYREIIRFDRQNTSIGLKSRINLLEFLSKFDNWKISTSSFHDFTEDNLSLDIKEAWPLVTEIIKSNFLSLNPIDRIYCRLSLAGTLLEILEKQDASFDNLKHPLEIAYDQSNLAFNEAKNIQNLRAASYAQGLLGKLYSKSKQFNQAIKYIENAEILALKTNAPEISFRWEAELGYLYSLSGKNDKARKSFEESINSIDIVRQNLITIPQEISSPISEEIESVYQKYLNFLITDLHDVKKALQINDLLHIAKIENFLGCNKLNLVSLSKNESKTLPPLIYALSLGNSIEIIVRDVNGIFHQHSANQKNILGNIRNLQVFLQNDALWQQDESSFMPYLQALYNEIIRPIKQFLPETGTLVFSTDELLQSIPLSMLHDGEKYLNDYYSVTNSTGAESIKKTPSHYNNKILIGGLSKTSPSFSDPYAPKNLQPLPQILKEVEEIKKYSTNEQSLLDEKFTVSDFQDAITRSKYPVIHITTHGQYSSDPKETVLLAWDRVLNVTEIDQLLKSSNENYDILDLLVLSACQTAKGDSKSALGIAGILTQAGAKSVVASLWQSDADATVLFMDYFYRALDDNKSKSDSLRLAQKALRDNAKFRHPYYWAPFVLVGDWA